MSRTEGSRKIQQEAYGSRPTETREYRAWINMKTRCNYPHSPYYPNYGGRGISVCERWQNSFADFLSDVGPRPNPKHSLDRIDPDGNYEPGNVRWATRVQQQRNIRTNRLVELNGETVPLAEAADGAPVPYNTVLYRLKRGWRLEDALSRPPKKGFRPHG